MLIFPCADLSDSLVLIIRGLQLQKRDCSRGDPTENLNKVNRLVWPWAIYGYSPAAEYQEDAKKENPFMKETHTHIWLTEGGRAGKQRAGKK